MKMNILPKLILIVTVLASACAPKKDDSEVLKKLTVIEQKIDSLSSANEPNSSSRTSDPDKDHVAGHIIDPPDDDKIMKTSKMAKIEIHRSIHELTAGDIIYGINSRQISVSKNDTVYFYLAYDPSGTKKKYYAYDLCLKDKCH
ncbi:hypothetical protein SanaruYs_30110 [Chryseotalea sanaruensis]|uniref:Lipoprotein n=1 Tax=Chryseotalea sanaruensis TaxID=2482724 RepID=A0A401UD44_9BACT|nr:hypothetical protein [Chryseotalea sanaruensis]GCC52772.1 hypothetical protein SanaruYs_30110 [Chryseotalea sanaruensis]